MTEDEAREQFETLLSALAVERGDTVYFGIDISALPLPSYPSEITRESMRDRANKWCEFVLGTLLNYLGPQGTLIVPTFAYDCAAPNIIFDLEETPSDVGPFTNFVRLHPKAVRSLHPIFSLAGIGKHAKDILSNTGRSAFGPLSSFGRLAKYDAKFVCLGVPFSLSITYMHHLEQMHGCNHRYHKILESKVYSNGKEVPGPWLAYLNYRGVTPKADFSSIEKRLREEGVLFETNFRGAPYQCVTVANVDEFGMKMLDGNSCAFLERDVVVRLNESIPAQIPKAADLVEITLIPSCVNNDL
ncbi:MAG: AAC(3) family N-acetyltransferase [Magnetovibrio sp.]|nr:AAC(3) family N-acetyltransferase [Magnetovibrio sp.]